MGGFVTCAEDNWKILQSCIVASAKESIGRGFRNGLKIVIHS